MGNVTLSKAVKYLYAAIGALAMGLIIWFAFDFSPVQLPALSTLPPAYTPQPTQITPPTSTPQPTATATNTPTPTLVSTKKHLIVVHKLYGDDELIEFTAPTTWEFQISGVMAEKYLGERTGKICSNYSLWKNREAILYINPPCGFSEGIPSDCPPDTVLIWEEDEPDEYGRRSAYARYYNEQEAAYIYASAWIGNRWTTGNPGVYCLYTSSEVGDDNFLKAFYIGTGEEKVATLQELDLIVLSITGIDE